MPDSTTRSFALITDEQAKSLANVCPPHKVIIDCGWGIPVAANAVGCGAQTIERLIAPFYERIQETPDLKKTVATYALEAHEIEKQLWSLAQRLGTIAVTIGVAIESADYKPALKTP